MVSVGSFRSFNHAASVPNGKVVIVDVDPRLVAFNDRLMQLVLSSANRHEFLARLLGRDVDRASLAEVRATRNSRAADLAFLDRVNQQPESEALRQDPLYRVVNGLKLARPFDEEMGEWLADAARVDEAWSAQFFGSDASFRNLQAMIRRGQVVNLNGSLSGDTTLRELGMALRSGKLRVAAVDLSNVLDYVHGDRAAKLLRNLELLPLGKGAVFYTTGQKAPDPGDLWGYYALDLEQLKASVQAKPEPRSFEVNGVVYTTVLPPMTDMTYPAEARLGSA